MLANTNKIAVKNRPFWTESVSGDALVCKQESNKVLLAVIDGTGHGIEAHQVATKLATLIEKSANWTTPDELILSLHLALSPSIGASVGIVIIDNKQHQIAFAGVGNIGTSIIGQHDVSFVCNHGAVGAQMRKVVIQHQTLYPGDIILMHSDGIKSKVYTQYDAEMMKQPSSQIIDYIFSHFVKQHDDASCIVFRY